MSTKIYIVTGTSGEYSDRTDWNVCAVHTQEHAERLADKLNRLSVFKNAFRNRVYNEFVVVYDREHPGLNVPMPNGPAASPEFRRLMAISAANKTVQDKASFRQLQAEHMRALEEWKVECGIIREANGVRWREKEAARAAWVKENYNPDSEFDEVLAYSKEPAGSYHSDARYHFEELELL